MSERVPPDRLRIVRVDTGEVVAVIPDLDLQGATVEALKSEPGMNFRIEAWDSRHESWVRLGKAPFGTRLQWLASVLIAIVVVGGLVAFIFSRVCDEELTQDGEAVTVCRHLQASDPPVVAMGLVALAALGAFFTEISGFGVSLKRDVKEVQQGVKAVDQKVGVVGEAAETAQQTATDAMQTLESVKDDIEYGESPRISAEEISPGASAVKEETIEDGESPRIPAEEISSGASPMAQLAGEYNTVRSTMPPGAKRTARMEQIVREMIKASRSLDDFDIKAHLESEDRGLRLAGCAYLHAKPDPRWVRDLVDTIISEDKPFGQYWALRSLREQLKADPKALDQRSRGQLENLLVGLPSGSDRAVQLRMALEQDSR